MLTYTLEDLKRTLPVHYFEEFIMNNLFKRFYNWLKGGNEPLITDVTDISEIFCHSFYHVVVGGRLIKIDGLARDIAGETDVCYMAVEKVSFEGEETQSVELEKRFRRFIKNQNLKELMEEAEENRKTLVMLED